MILPNTGFCFFQRPWYGCLLWHMETNNVLPNDFIQHSYVFVRPVNWIDCPCNHSQWSQSHLISCSVESSPSLHFHPVLHTAIGSYFHKMASFICKVRTPFSLHFHTWSSSNTCIISYTHSNTLSFHSENPPGCWVKLLCYGTRLCCVYFLGLLKEF